jgi:hypothetical protein
MSKSKRLGLDELMIVNPDSIDGAAYLLGDDSVLYRVEGGAENRQQEGLGQVFLGEDGALYQVQGLGAAEPSEPHSPAAEMGGTLGRFFLGDNGMLYEVVDHHRAAVKPAREP